MTRRAAAGRYARALFDVAKAEGKNLEQIAQELSGVAALVSQNEELQRVLGNPAIPPDRKRAVMAQLLARSPVTAVLSRVLLLLADRDRLVLLPEVAESFQSRLMDHQNVVRAEVSTAVPLPHDRVSAFERSLAQATGRRVQLEMRVDPSILGGAVARIGSTVYDGSVITQLEKMKQRLVQAET